MFEKTRLNCLKGTLFRAICQEHDLPCRDSINVTLLGLDRNVPIAFGLSKEAGGDGRDIFYKEKRAYPVGGVDRGEEWWSGACERRANETARTLRQTFFALLVLERVLRNQSGEAGEVTIQGPQYSHAVLDR